MKKGFELNDYRVMDNKELVNILTNTAATVNRLYESDIVYGEEMILGYHQHLLQMLLYGDIFTVIYIN